MVKPEIRALEERRRIGELSDTWRTIASSTPPWNVIDTNGAAILMDTRENARLGTLEGHWTPNVARYLNAMSPYAGLKLAELLWLIGGHGSEERVRQYAFGLFGTMGLRPPPAPRNRGR
jgi:hypothetical protein